MKLRFLLLLFFVILTYAGVQSKRRYKSPRPPIYRPRPSPTRRPYRTTTTTTRRTPDYQRPTTTRRSFPRSTAAPTTSTTYPPWANPYLLWANPYPTRITRTTKPPAIDKTGTSIRDKSNTSLPIKIPVLHTTRSPLDNKILIDTHYKTQNNTTMKKPQTATVEPFHQTRVNESQLKPILNHPPYPHQQGPVFYPMPRPSVIVLSNPQNNDRGVGKILEEAVIYSGVNAAVDRIVNPSLYHHHHHHYHHDGYWQPVGESSNVETSNTHVTTHTEITYNNQYINTVPESNGSVPGQPDVLASTNFSQSDQVAPPVHTAAPVNGTETPATTFQYRITNEELQSLSEELFNKDEFNAYKYISLDIQGRSTGANVSDQAARPLFKVMPVAHTIPTVQALRSLYQHYTPDSRVKENMTVEKRMKENVLLDIFLTTNVMSITTKWLYKQGFVRDDDYEKKDMLRRLWFTQFDGTSSAFERVFAAEIFEGTDVLGVQDWIHFDYLESNNRIDYLGFVDKLQFGDKAAMLKVDFRFDGALRHNGTVFVGTSPELEMALYTICYHARPGDMCPISLGGTKLNLFTNPYRYLDKDTIDLALPLF